MLPAFIPFICIFRAHLWHENFIHFNNYVPRNRSPILLHRTYTVVVFWCISFSSSFSEEIFHWKRHVINRILNAYWIWMSRKNVRTLFGNKSCLYNSVEFNNVVGDHLIFWYYCQITFSHYCQITCSFCIIMINGLHQIFLYMKWYFVSNDRQIFIE